MPAQALSNIAQQTLPRPWAWILKDRIIRIPV
jgi:hypothetical protein